MTESTESEFLQFLTDNKYFNVRKLPDGTYAALYKLMFTTAICTGLSFSGWAYRYCFDDPELAAQELAKLEAMDDEPKGFIARRWGAREPRFTL